MVAISFIENSATVQQRLLEYARGAILEQLDNRAFAEPPRLAGDDPLWELGCCFVTLEKQNFLRGCIGSLEPYRPLFIDLLQNSLAAAFRDPRFRPVERKEMCEINISISIVGSATAIPFASEKELLQALVPKKDGLILQFGNQRATFLPSVWESLPEPENFVAELKLKAGLNRDFWSEQIRAFRYYTFSFSEL